MSIKDKKFILGITGSIAAYKACDIVRLLTKLEAQVFPVLTLGAEKFITAMTLQALAGNRVRSNIYDLSEESEMDHISLADSADGVIIAPANANFMAKASHGICDDLLSTILIATKAPVFLAPAMNVNMYKHPLTQRNISTLKEIGYHLIGPASGDLACGWQGMGRLEDPQKIVDTIVNYFS